MADFHFYPVIIHGNVATIYTHNNALRYNHKYTVQIDSGVFASAASVFEGFTTGQAWNFTTKLAPPPANATRGVVAADGSGDFNTVQGAVDFAPDNPPQPVTIFIKNGTYEEIVNLRETRVLPTPSLERVGREGRKSPRMRATRIKPMGEASAVGERNPGLARREP